MAKAPRSLVLGTAGHIDHGKTTLVGALTGVDTDRLGEEKRRGITIELGFAPLDLGRGFEVSIVDVPGHDGFVRTMVAGASGIDMVLLVVSAVDGVMPQTREHLHICSLLGVRRCVVAVTMIDRHEGDSEAIELACEDVRDTLAGTTFADAPIVPCSAHTQEGLADLRQALRKLATSLPSRPSSDRPILAVDRAFAMKGHGTVVTGTLLCGQLHARNLGELRLVCTGDRHPVGLRVRAMQVRGDDQNLARAGTRTALNLGGLAVREVHRGDVVTCGHRVVQTEFVHAWVDHLAHDPRTWEFGTTVQLCAGTAHCTATLDPLGSDGTLAPSAQGVVRLRLSTPIPAWAGQRLILRAFVNPRGGDLKLADAGCTIGGGTVLDPNPGSGRGQRTHWQQLTTLLRSDDPAVRLAGIVDDAGVRGIDLADLEARSGVPLDPGAPLPGVPEQAIVALSQNRVVAAKALGPLIRRALVRVDQFHVANPSQPGMPRAVLEQQLTGRACPDVVAAALVHALDAGELRAGEDASLVSLPGQGLHTGDANPAWIQAILDIFVARGTSPPTTRDLTTATGNSERQVFEAISVLQRQGALARISREMSMAMQAHGQLIELVRQHLAAEGNMDMQAFKQRTGLSRKFAVPFLEHLDRLQITRRSGNNRVPGPKA